jgi:dihydrofolate reductase
MIHWCAGATVEGECMSEFVVDTFLTLDGVMQASGRELHVVGSHDLLRTLVRHDLVDVYRLMIFPVVLGTGKRLFDGGAVPAAFTLTEAYPTPGGAVFCAYRRAGEVTYGSVG